jgi:hypothetical protein
LPSFSDNDRDFLVILVDAKYLDYSSPEALLSTIAKHQDGTTERDIGHAWIVLNGIKEGKLGVVIEGGHSGELGLRESKRSGLQVCKLLVLQTCRPDPLHFF